tara:strand:+ start:79 stop:336 length:258 start_codon:yes stop_codon:yes gene_type:complete
MRINPQNFYNRRTNKCLSHYSSTVLSVTESRTKQIDEWIFTNCYGRYSITKDIVQDKRTFTGIKIGFELPSDLTLFALSGLMTAN